MKILHFQLAILLLIFAMPSMAQTRDKTLTITVTTDTGDNLDGQSVMLMQTDYSLSYGTLRLNSDGQCIGRVYGGNHEVSVERDGYAPAATTFTIPADATEAAVSLHLTEKTKTPFALEAQPLHNAYTGVNSIRMTWNTEPPAFFDDFEAYEPFAVEFGEWTGIDADQEAAAPLLGDYPNRCVMQYAQIINPLAVTPTWWYDYPILRPYSGKQYVGFTRTNSGNGNDDWLITPVINVGTEHSLIFMGKAADKYPERFQVYITTQIDNPQQADFIRLDGGNYETADYTGWRQYEYDLSNYAGQQVKIAIRCISNYNMYGSFMLMIDDLFVGQARSYGETAAKVAAQRAPRRSDDNPNEVFHLFLDEQEVGTTTDYTYTIDNVTSGSHTIGVKASYLATESELVTTNVDVPDNFSPVIFHVITESILNADGQHINLVSTATSESYDITIADGKATIASLPHGEYVVNIEEGAFNEYLDNITVEGPLEVNITLTDRMVTPYNITADTNDESGDVTLHWNQELVFYDSFEDYDDFATEIFGEWYTMDMDHTPVYPIALGDITNIISFPGSGTANNPMPIAPIVFNPWNTTPPMLPTDMAVAAPTGDKTIVFFSPQRAQADKWLISPEIDIHEGYVMQATLKSYDMMYPESVEFCVSTEGAHPLIFTPISSATNIPAGEWTIYQTDLSDYEGERVRLAVHYISYDTFFLQLDDFTVGPEDGGGETVDYGNVIRYDIYLDGGKVAETMTPAYTFTELTPGTHIIGIVAIYQHGQSEMGTITINVSTSITTPALSSTPSTEIYDLQGRKVRLSSSLPRGVYIKKDGVSTKPIIVK